MGRVFLSAPTLFSQMWALPGPDPLLTLTCEGRTSSCPLFCYENVRAAPIQASLLVHSLNFYRMSSIGQ